MALEPEVLEYKLYAPGVGPVLTLGVSGGVGREALVEHGRVSTSIAQLAGETPLGRPYPDPLRGRTALIEGPGAAPPWRWNRAAVPGRQEVAMTTRVAPSVSHDRRAEPIAAALEQQGLLDPQRHDEALAALDQALAGTSGRPSPTEPAALRRRLVELAAYVGGAFVVAAGVLFAAREWADLSVSQRVGLLGGVAVVLAAAGVAVVVVTGGRRVVLEPVHDARRRLAAALVTGAGFATAAAVMVAMIDWVERTSNEQENGELIGLAASATLLVLVVLGYLYVPALAGQLAAAFATMYLVPFALMGLDLYGAVLHGLLVVGVGALWLLLAETGRWREVLPARVVGAAMLVIGAQIPIGSADYPWVAYVGLAVVALVGFTLYVVRRAWPYLAAGVAGVTLAVPEALLDWTEGSLGTAGVLLVAGVTLLAASLLGLQLRNETDR